MTKSFKPISHQKSYKTVEGKKKEKKYMACPLHSILRVVFDSGEEYSLRTRGKRRGRNE